MALSKAILAVSIKVFICAMTLSAVAPHSQPIATYNTDVFDYWHLNGEAWAKNLPPLTPEQTDILHDYAYSLALQAAVWGSAPVTFYALRYNDALGSNPKAQPNEIWRMDDISTPKLAVESGYVTPNVNTLYGFGFMDLNQEPIILTVPDSKGRYYMVEICDMYTNAFAYVGGVATGYNGGIYALIGPGWKGTLPAGVRRIDSPTRWLLLQPRVHIKGTQDLAEARKVLDQITTQPLSRYLGTQSPAPVTYNYPAPQFADPKLPVSANYYKDPLQFWEILSNVINENPPPQDQITALLPLFAPLGIELGKNWDRTKIHPVVLTAMKKAAENVDMKTLIDIPSGRLYKGWLFGWPSIGNFRTDYLNRAFIARVGLTGNTPEEAIYLFSYFDSKNKPPVGENNYTLTFEPPPFKEPGFWSATMYDFNNNYTVENSINRYSLGSDDKLIMNKDGTVTLYIQNKSPGADKEANWLPSPEKGRFYIILRSYAPGQKAIESLYNPEIWSPGPLVQIK